MGRPPGPRDGSGLNAAVRQAVPWLLLIGIGCAGDVSNDAGVAEGALPRELLGGDPELVEFVQQARSEIAADPQDPAAWRRLGQIYQANRLYDPAIDAYDRAVAQAPDDARAWYGLGCSSAGRGLAAEALTAFDRVAALVDYPPVAWRRGFALLDLGRLEAARAAFDAAVAQAPDDPAGHAGLARIDLLEGDPEAAIARLEPLVRQARGGSDYLHHLLGTAYRQAGRTEDAARELQRGRNSVAVWRDPWNEETLALRRGFDWTLSEARRALRDGRVDLALPALERLRRQRPDDRDLLITLATGYTVAGRESDAAETMRELARRHPDDDRAQIELSRFHDRGRRYRQALRHAERATELNPSFAPAWRQLARVWLHQSRPDRCEPAADTATRLAPSDPGGWKLLGRCRLALARWNAAVDAYERALAESAEDPVARAGLAYAASRAGRNARAAEALQHLRDSGAKGRTLADAVDAALSEGTEFQP